MTLRRLRRLRPKEEDAAAAPERPGPADVYRALAAAGGTLPRVRKVGLAAAPGAGRAGEPPRCPRFVPRGRWGPGAAISNAPWGGSGGARWPRLAQPLVPAPCGAAPAASPGLWSCPGDPPDLCPVSPSCPGDIPPSCPRVSPPRSHLPPASSQSPRPTPVLSPRHVLSQFLPTSGTGPHPSVRGHVTRTNMCPPGSAPQGRQGRRSLGVWLHGTWDNPPLCSWESPFLVALGLSPPRRSPRPRGAS